MNLLKGTTSQIPNSISLVESLNFNLLSLAQLCDLDENLDDVRGTQLVNAMKNMDIGDIRPREEINVEDDKDQVLCNSNEQASDSHDQVQASASDDKV